MNERLIGSAACSACKFAVADAKGTLACRRMPPVAAPIIMQVKGELPRMVGQSSIFPQVHPAHWCGEFVRSLAVAAGASPHPTDAPGPFLSGYEGSPR